MVATLAAAIFGSGRDLVCSPVLSPREGRFAYMTHVLGGMALDRPPGRHVWGHCLGPRPRGWTTW